MKQIFRSILCLSLAVAAGCQSDKSPLPSNRLILNLQDGDLPSLNPYLGLDLKARCLFLALYEPLMRRNPDGTLDFAAAQSVDIDSTRTIYTFHIRPHQWSNGEIVTSHHFANAWKYALTPGTPCIRPDLLYPIRNAEQVKKGMLPLEKLKLFTPDEQTLIVELENPIPYFLDLTATSFFAPLYNASLEDQLFFNGPFQIKERNHSQNLIFKKNPLYWDAANVDLEEICFTLVRDAISAYRMYQNGELDLVGDPFCPLPLDFIPPLKSLGNLKSKLISRISYVLINTTEPPLNNTALRKALSLSIDREMLTEQLTLGEVPAYSFLPASLTMVNKEEFGFEDPKILFEQALSELSIDKEHFPSISLSYSEVASQKPIAEFLQSQWKNKLGIHVEINGNQWNSHIAKLRTKNYQIGTLSVTTVYQDPMFFFEFFKERASFFNYTGWEDSNLRDQLNLANQTIDPQKRRKIMEDAEVRLFQGMPAIPLFTQNLQYLVKKNVNLAISDQGIYDFKKTKKRQLNTVRN